MCRFGGQKKREKKKKERKSTNRGVERTERTKNRKRERERERERERVRTRIWYWERLYVRGSSEKSTFPVCRMSSTRIVHARFFPPTLSRIVAFAAGSALREPTADRVTFKPNQVARDRYSTKREKLTKRENGRKRDFT